MVHALVDIALSSVTQFGLYSLLALSLSFVFGVSGIVNLAVGDFAAVGAYAMIATADLPFAARVIATVVVAAPLLYLLERSLLGRLRSGLAGMLVTWGIGIAIRQIFEVAYSATPRSVAAPVGGSVSVLGAVYPVYRLLIAGVGLAVTVVALVVASRTRAGLRLRAVSDNGAMAALLGTNPQRVRALTFAVAGTFAVLAGAIYSPLLGVSPSMGFNLLIPGFVALLLARPGSFRGAVVAVALVVVLQVVLRRAFTDTVADSFFYVVVLVAVVIRANPHIRRLLTWFARRAQPLRGGPA